MADNFTGMQYGNGGVTNFPTSLPLMAIRMLPILNL